MYEIHVDASHCSINSHHNIPLFCARKNNVETNKSIGDNYETLISWYRGWATIWLCGFENTAIFHVSNRKIFTQHAKSFYLINLIISLQFACDFASINETRE